MKPVLLTLKPYKIQYRYQVFDFMYVVAIRMQFLEELYCIVDHFTKSRNDHTCVSISK